MVWYPRDQGVNEPVDGRLETFGFADPGLFDLSRRSVWEDQPTIPAGCFFNELLF